MLFVSLLQYLLSFMVALRSLQVIPGPGYCSAATVARRAHATRQPQLGLLCSESRTEAVVDRPKPLPLRRLHCPMALGMTAMRERAVVLYWRPTRLRMSIVLVEKKSPKCSFQDALSTFDADGYGGSDSPGKPCRRLAGNDGVIHNLEDLDVPLLEIALVLEEEPVLSVNGSVYESQDAPTEAQSALRTRWRTLWAHRMLAKRHL